MKRKVGMVVVLVLLLSMAVPSAEVFGAKDDYETLEFFLDQALKRAKDHHQKAEILDRYLIKALGMIYQQNREVIRLQRQMLNTLQELQEIAAKEKRELEEGGG